MTNNLQEINSGVLAERRYGYGGYDSSQDKEDTLDLRTLWRSLMGYKWSILFITLLASIIAVLVSLSMTPSYRAVGTIQIQRDVGRVTNYKINVAENQTTGKDFYQTQYTLLQSRELARRVIDRLGIRNKIINDNIKQEQNKSIFDQYINKVKVWILESKKSFEQSVGVTIPFPKPKVQLGQISQEVQFLGGLKIIPDESQIVTIQYEHSDPVMASKIVNMLAEEFVKMNLERSTQWTSGEKDKLYKQRDLAKETLDQKERELADYARKNSIMGTGGNEELVYKQLREISAALIQADNRYAEMKSRYDYKSLGVGRVSIAPERDSATVLTLKARLAQKLAEYEEKSKDFKPAYPDMISLEKQIRQLRVLIQKEQSRATVSARRAREKETRMSEASLRKAYLAALQTKKSLAKKLDDKKWEAFQFKKKKIKYDALEREVNLAKKSYDELASRAEAVTIATNLKSKNNVSVVDKADIPFHQFKPNFKFNLVVGTLIGLFLGIVLSFLRNMLNDTVRSSVEIERLSNLPILGSIPKIKVKEVKKQALLTFSRPQSAIAEACRSLRTTLLFSTDNDPKVVLITSPMPNEGKTTTAVNLASAFVQAGKKVLLIDADLRKPSLHNRLQLDNSMGLAPCLVGECRPEEAIQFGVLGDLSVLTAGRVANNPIGLFTSEKMSNLLKELSKTYDNIILDAPPVMGLADSLVLANISSVTLMVASHGQTNRRRLVESCNKIHQARGNLLGCIYTKVGVYDDGYSQNCYVYGNRRYGLVS